MRRQNCLIVSIIFLIFFLMIGSLSMPGTVHTGHADPNDLPKEAKSPPALTFSPKEIDMGLLSAGRTLRAVITLQNSGTEPLNWSAAAPEGWALSGRERLAGSLLSDAAELRVRLKVPQGELSDRARAEKSPLPVQLILEAGDQVMTATKSMETGEHRETVRLQSNGGAGLLHFSFRLVDKNTEPLIGVNPTRVDFGVAVKGEQVGRRVRLNNQGWNTLKWKAVYGEKADRGDRAPAIRGKQISFFNEEALGAGLYAAPRHLKDRLELSGKWTQEQGYPSAPEEGGSLRYRFSGTGVSVYFRKGPDKGQLAVFLDDKFLFQQDALTEHAECAEFLVAEGLPNAVHTLVLVNRNAPVAIEGIRVYGSDIMMLNAAGIALSPREGVVTRQTNYVNIAVDTRKLTPGHYGGVVAFDSNGGRVDVELSMDIVQDNVPKILDVYRYIRESDYFLTTNPQSESTMLQTRGYQKQGVAFRLFSPGVPGTTEFYRWFHPARGDHFYGYHLKSAKRPMQGYILEGTIGNIATSRLTSTRELYRWYHPSKRQYFFTVDPKGEGIQKKGYQFDGIAGYVRP
jgi:hypothetical protein